MHKHPVKGFYKAHKLEFKSRDTMRCGSASQRFRRIDGHTDGAAPQRCYGDDDGKWCHAGIATSRYTRPRLVSLVARPVRARRGTAMHRVAYTMDFYLYLCKAPEWHRPTLK